MLQWLKDALGDGYTDEIDKKVSKAIGEHFVSKADFNEANEAKKRQAAELEARDKQLEELKGKAGQSEELKQEIERLRQVNEQTKAEAEAQRQKDRLEAKIAEKLRSAKAVDITAVRALLDAEKIKLDGDTLIGIDDQIKALQAEKKWAFETSPGIPGAGGNPPPGTAPPQNKRPTGTAIF